jgi:hypothetical protein
VSYVWDICLPGCASAAVCGCLRLVHHQLVMPAGVQAVTVHASLGCNRNNLGRNRNNLGCNRNNLGRNRNTWDAAGGGADARRDALGSRPRLSHRPRAERRYASAQEGSAGQCRCRGQLQHAVVARNCTGLTVLCDSAPQLLCACSATDPTVHIARCLLHAVGCRLSVVCCILSVQRRARCTLHMVGCTVYI